MKLVMIAALLLAGCASLPANPSSMTPEQLKEWVKDKNANLGCGVVNSPYGRGVMVYVVLDKGLIVNGQVVIDDQCKVTISNSIPAK